MMSDLAQLLAQLEREEFTASVGAQLPQTGRHAVRDTVARARRLRTAATMGAAALALVALATGAWALTSATRDEPAAPSSSPSVSAAPTALPTDSFPSFSGDVTTGPRVPSAEPITAAAWNAAGDGWVLATYREFAYKAETSTAEDVEVYGPQVAYLISPDGVRYQLTEIAGVAGARVVEWEPGATTALVLAEVTYGEYSIKWAVLDLTTGAIKAVTPEDVAESSWYQPTIADTGQSNWGGQWPDFDTLEGADVLRELPLRPTVTLAGDVRTAIATAQELMPDGEECTRTIVLATMVAVECGSELTVEGLKDSPWYAHYFVFVDDAGVGSGTVVDVRMATESATVVPSLDGDWGPATTSGDSVIAIGGAEGLDFCAKGRYVINTGGALPLAGVAALKGDNNNRNMFTDAGTVGSTVYTVIGGGCAGDIARALVADHIEDRTYVVLIPFPTESAQPSDLDPPLQSIVSAYVVGAH